MKAAKRDHLHATSDGYRRSLSENDLSMYFFREITVVCIELMIS
jgi:hypothetical protein